jgi:hypothetical protein
MLTPVMLKHTAGTIATPLYEILTGVPITLGMVDGKTDIIWGRGLETLTLTKGEYDLAEAHVEQRTSTTIISVAVVIRDTRFEDEKSNTQLNLPKPNKSDETIRHIVVFSLIRLLAVL